MAKKKNADPTFGHVANDDNVCARCGLEMPYLLAAGAEDPVAAECWGPAIEEVVEEVPA